MRQSAVFINMIVFCKQQLPKHVEMLRSLPGLLALQQTPSLISKIKDITESVKSVVTIISLIVGGVWTYTRFIKKREKFPRAKIGHSITHRKLDDKFVLVHVAVNVTNTSEVLLELVSGFTRVLQIVPPDATIMEALRSGRDPVDEDGQEYNWREIGLRQGDWEASPHEIEPGEEDEIGFDFAVDSQVATVEIYSYFKNKSKRGREIGWNLSTVYDTSPATDKASESARLSQCFE